MLTRNNHFKIQVINSIQMASTGPIRTDKQTTYQSQKRSLLSTCILHMGQGFNKRDREGGGMTFLHSKLVNSNIDKSKGLRLSKDKWSSFVSAKFSCALHSRDSFSHSSLPPANETKNPSRSKHLHVQPKKYCWKP